jgi:hypothetical protein
VIRKKSKILRIILLATFGGWLAYKLVQTGQNDFFLDGIILLLISFVGLLIFIWSIFKDRKEFMTTQKLTSYFPTLVGLTFILLNLALFYYQDRRTNAPTLISGFNDGGFSVDFKTNGNYVMANGSGLGQSYFYGTYSIRDSIITIDKANIDNCIKSNKLIIRTDKYYQKDSVDLLKSKANYITQIDNNGNELDRELRYRVTQDNRNMRNQ